jgi:cytochrome P450
MLTSGLMGRGEEWKRIRTFMQTDLMQPESARGYVPGMVEAARLASAGAPASADDLNNYLGRCAFDLFSTIMFGELTNVSDMTTPTDPDNEVFVKSAADGLSASIQILVSPYEMVLGNQLGLSTKKCQFAFANFDKCWEIAQAKIERFGERNKLGQLSVNEKASYLARALDRQLEEGCNVSLREVHELAFAGLFAAVDTTSSVLGWNLFNISRCEEVQEKLHKEIVQAVRAEGGKDCRLSAAAVDRKQSPYLHATIRETQRLTPPAPMFITKRIYQDDVVLHGVPMKQGDVVSLEGYTTGTDPELIDSPEEFRPERWFPEAVEARKGTKKEIIDHPYLKDPFSQGMFSVNDFESAGVP